MQPCYKKKRFHAVYFVYVSETGSIHSDVKVLKFGDVTDLSKGSPTAFRHSVIRARHRKYLLKPRMSVA